MIIKAIGYIIWTIGFLLAIGTEGGVNNDLINSYETLKMCFIVLFLWLVGWMMVNVSAE